MGQMVDDVERSVKGRKPVQWYGKCGWRCADAGRDYRVGARDAERNKIGVFSYGQDIPETQSAF